MNCTELRAQLDDLVDGSLPPAVHEAAQRHLVDCAACRKALEQERVFRGHLRAHPVPPPSPGFAQRALHRARAQRSGHGHRGFAVGFISATAAALLAWLAVSVFLPGGVKQEALPGVTLTLHETQSVKLVFNVPRDLPDATLSLQLPAHIELAGYPDQRELVWQAALHTGQNLLTVPLIARDNSAGELIAKIAYRGEKKTFRLRLTVNAPRTSSRIRAAEGMV